MHWTHGIKYQFGKIGPKFSAVFLKSHLQVQCSGVTAGGRGGGRCSLCPLTLLTGKFLLSYREKRGKEKRENGEEKRKIEKGKVENWKWQEEKLKNAERTFFQEKWLCPLWKIFLLRPSGAVVDIKSHFVFRIISMIQQRHIEYKYWSEVCTPTMKRFLHAWKACS